MTKHSSSRPPGPTRPGPTTLGEQLSRVADTRSLESNPHASRGALSNAPSRYIARRSHTEDDGWATIPDESMSPMSGSSSKVATEFFADKTRTLITRNQSPDIGFDRSINPYKGCEHGCIYCFARPTHAYLDLSAGLDFERKVFYKTDVVNCLATEFAKPSYRCKPIAIGTNTDPYQPGEKRFGVMRQILQTLLAHRHPVTIVTKGQLLARDLDLLAQLAELNLVKVMVSVTTLSNDLKAKLEPRTAGPARRLKLISQLAAASIPVGAMVAPVIPCINDAELETIVASCAERGAQEINYILLRLPLEVRPLFEQWLAEHYPLRAAKVMKVICDTRGDKAYDAQWGVRMRGQGPYAQLLQSRFALAVKKAGLANAGTGMAPLDCQAFVPEPHKPQLSLF